MTGPKRYGFDDDEPPITLPKQPQVAKPKPAPEQAAAAVEAGRGLGFVPREVRGESRPQPTPATLARRKPGRRKGEPKTQLLISGPARVVDAFREHCEAEEITYWEAIEAWLKASERS